MEFSPFFTVHCDLPREGPGEPSDVHWALQNSGLSGAVDVLDAACGPGADLVTLAESLPEARITGIDKHRGFVATEQARVAAFGDRVQVRQGDIASPDGPFDLIWCAGALYFLGVIEGLLLWRDALKPGGWIAFSEPVLLEGPQPEAVLAFWEEYPQITDIDGIRKRVKDAGYHIENERMIVGDPWLAYYAPMKARIAILRDQSPSPELTAALEDSAREIALWEAAPDHIAYALLLVRPT